MKTEIIHISKKTEFANSFRSVISFKEFIDYLKFNVENGSSIKAPYFRWIVKKMEKIPALSGAVSIEQVKDYEEILELISTCLLPLTTDEKTLWALSSPMSPKIFYSTDGFHELMSYLEHPAIINPLTGDAESETEKMVQEFQYGLVLEKIYEFPYQKKTEWIRKFEDPATGLDKYFQVHIDTRFVDIRPIHDLPELDCTRFTATSLWGEEFKKLQQTIPLNHFEARGFSVLTLTDVTAQQAVREVAKLVIHNSQTDKRPLFEEVTHALQTVVGSPNFQFGLVPFLTINDRPALMYENFPYSIMVQACWKDEVSKHEFSVFRKDITGNPRTILWSATDQNEGFPEVISNAFRHAGIYSYMMLPVYHNQQITGIFEIGTQKDNPMLSDAQLLRLRPVLPIITQLIQDIIGRFNRGIENIIKEKFTSIQPAVQWKFNETAWHYMRDHSAENRNEVLENIVFKNLYPLYGEVDIKNSTIYRNEALKKDLTLQLTILTEMVSRLPYRSNPHLEHLLTTSRNWLEIIRDPINTQQEVRLNEFFNLEVQTEMENLLHTEPETYETMVPYFQAVDEENGAAFENRRQLEDTITLINGVVNNYYENASQELQQIFPCYFEKFRTDGVEYDIYVGQSIVPGMEFQKHHLQEIKRWQLESLIKVVHLVEDLYPDMAFPLQTTQMLFVHPQTIDITFRKDERRFDVEGAYNIRYHVIKKRIDKVLLLNSSERLTQPGKIALVYFDDRDAIAYKEIILRLQEEDQLKDDLEELELEPLQGVDGLKAIRVGIHIPERNVSLRQRKKLVHTD